MQQIPQPFHNQQAMQGELSRSMSQGTQLRTKWNLQEDNLKFNKSHDIFGAVFSTIYKCYAHYNQLKWYNYLRWDAVNKEKTVSTQEDNTGVLVLLCSWCDFTMSQWYFVLMGHGLSCNMWFHVDDQSFIYSSIDLDTQWVQACLQVTVAWLGVVGAVAVAENRSRHATVTRSKRPTVSSPRTQWSSARRVRYTSLHCKLTSLVKLLMQWSNEILYL